MISGRPLATARALRTAPLRGPRDLSRPPAMSTPRSSVRPAVLTLLATAALAGCGSTAAPGPRLSDRFLGMVTPYRVDVVQGNVVTREMAERIKLGMSRSQVREALGSPLIADTFHENRWDYVFTIRRAGTAYQQRRVTAVFKDDALSSFEAEDLPSEQDFVASIDTGRSGDKVPELSLSEKQLSALPPPKPTAAAAAAGPLTDRAVQGPARRYPPLEKP